MPRETTNRRVGRPRLCWTISNMKRAWDIMCINNQLSQNNISTSTIAIWENKLLHHPFNNIYSESSPKTRLSVCISSLGISMWTSMWHYLPFHASYIRLFDRNQWWGQWMCLPVRLYIYIVYWNRFVPMIWHLDRLNLYGNKHIYSFYSWYHSYNF